MGPFGTRRRRRQELEYKVALSRWRSFDRKWTAARDKLLEAREAGTTEGMDIIDFTSVEMQLRQSQQHRLTGNAFITFEGVQVYPINVMHPSFGLGRLIMEWTFGRKYSGLADPGRVGVIMAAGQGMIVARAGVGGSVA